MARLRIVAMARGALLVRTFEASSSNVVMGFHRPVSTNPSGQVDALVLLDAQVRDLVDVPRVWPSC